MHTLTIGVMHPISFNFTRKHLILRGPSRGAGGVKSYTYGRQYQVRGLLTRLRLPTFPLSLLKYST